MSDEKRPKYDVKIEQAQAVNVGDNMLVEQYFYAQPPSPPPISREELLYLFRQSGAEFDLYNDRIAGIRLERAEVAQITEWVLKGDSKHRLGMLLDQPGGGKTVVMRHVRQRLIDENVPVLAIKADNLSPVRSRDDLSRWLKLPLPVEDCVKQLLSEGPLVVLIDQLDALSLALSRDQATLDVMLDTIARLHALEGVRILASCRTFDLHNDPRLSAIDIDQKFQLQPLDESQINQVLQALGVAPEQLLPDHRHLLTVPLHLAIYARIIGETQPRPFEGFYSLQELYEALWRKRVTSTLLDSPPTNRRAEAIYQLVDAMRSRRETRAPIPTLDDYPDATDYLERVGFIMRERGNWHFFHQTLLDYCYARRFVAQGLSLNREVLSSAQGLFERSQIVQVLAHLRGTSEAEYHRELSGLLFNARLRVHLRLLVIGWFGSLPHPTAEELRLARRLLNSPDTRAHFLRAVSSNEGWFDLLNEEVLPALLRSDDEGLLDTVVNYLSTLIQRRTAAVLERLRPFLGSSEVWDARMDLCLSRLDDWQSKEALDVFCDLLRRGQAWRCGSSTLYDLARSNPPAACRALRVYLEQRLETLLVQERAEQENAAAETELKAATDKLPKDRFSWSHQLLGDHAVAEIMKRAVQVCPADVIEYLLPWFVSTALRLAEPARRDDLYPSDSLFSWGWHGEHIMEGAAFARQISEALRHLAKTQPDEFRAIALAMSQVEALAIQRVLIHAYLANPEAYAQDIFDYLVADIRRLDIGEALESPHYDSCRLYDAAFRCGNPAQRASLERLVLDYQPTWEKASIGHRGITQLRLLKGVPSGLLSETARRVLRELERKFPSFELRRPEGFKFGAVGPPIERSAMDKMSDDAWLGAMSKYDDSTGWGAPREEFLKGGVVELSRAFAEQVKAEPERFYNLVREFPNDISPYYIAAAISGLSEADAPAEWVFDLTRRHAGRLQGEHRRSAMWALEKRAKVGVPDDLLVLLEGWAIHDPDPHRETWQTQSSDNDRFHHLNEPHHQGINSNRGVAVNAVRHCSLMRQPPQVKRAFALLERASEDPSTAVRACVIESLSYLLNHDDQRVMAIFDRTLDGHSALLRCQVTHRFLYWTYPRQFSRIRRYIEQMLTHDDKQARQYGAVLACLSAFQFPEAKLLAEQTITGDTALRQGAAQVYAQNLDKAELEQVCLTNLERLISDSDDPVREEVGRCFAHARSDITERMKQFIRLFLDSPTLLAGSRYLVEYLRPLAADEPELALDVTKRILDVAGEQVVDVRTSAALIERDLVQLPLSVYTHTDAEAIKGRAMDLFERLLLMGSHSAHQALQDYDRR